MSWLIVAAVALFLFEAAAESPRIAPTLRFGIPVYRTRAAFDVLGARPSNPEGLKQRYAGAWLPPMTFVRLGGGSVMVFGSIRHMFGMPRFPPVMRGLLTIDVERRQAVVTGLLSWWVLPVAAMLFVGRVWDPLDLKLLVIVVLLIVPAWIVQAWRFRQVAIVNAALHADPDG